jgi:hypothetical protein
LKNLAESKCGTRKLEKLDATELKRRAAEDAVKDADSYATTARPQTGKTSAVKGLDQVSHLMKGVPVPAAVETPEGIDGILVRANDCGSSLVLSDEVLQISLVDEVAALTSEPIKIFHVHGPTPWVEQVIAGKA